MKRAFLIVSAAVAARLLSCASFASVSEIAGGDASAIDAADLRYPTPVSRGEEGMPVGNGRMGTLVWTTPSAIRMQINRVDVFGIDSSSRSFFERHGDYCGGIGFVDVDFGDCGSEPFSGEDFSQHLSVRKGVTALDGAGVSTRIVAWPERDVIAIAIDDRRGEGNAVRVALRMLRYVSQYHSGNLEAMVEGNIVKVNTRNHSATCQLSVRDGRIVLTQEFREGKFYNKSAIVIGIHGRAAKARIAHEGEVRLSAAPGKGQFTVLVASAASFDPVEDVVVTALADLAAAEDAGMAGIEASTAAWWADFWSRGHVELHSADGVAEMIAENYHYFLYLMGATSRGAFPPKFNGMLWNTGGDMRAWGGQQWFANLSCYYEALPATNRIELMDPFFAMYSKMRDKLSVAARQQWGSRGIYIPETVWFDGLASLPEGIAQEMRDLYLLRKPWEERSAEFMEDVATRHPHSSRYNWIGGGRWIDGRWVIEERGSGPYGPVSHILGTTAKVPYLYWRRYEYTLDESWLREVAYPMVRDAAEFYRNFPHVRREADGLFHINHVNSNESVWGARDTDEDLSAMRGIFAAAIRASEILEVDEKVRADWREFLAHLAPLPVSDHPDALISGDYEGPRVWVRGLKPAVSARFPSRPDGNSLPMWFFDLCNLESSDAEALAVANATFDSYFPNGIGPQTPVGVLSKLAIAAATLGRADAVRHLLPNQIRVLRLERSPDYVLKGGAVLANRMTMREGPQAIDAQRLGRAAEALHLALLQSNPPAPAEEPVIRVFPAWPPEWDARYTLLARGAFVVSSSITGGEIEFVELRSKVGARGRLRNPWGDRAVILQRDGRAAETMRGELVEFPTSAGETIVVRLANH